MIFELILTQQLTIYNNYTAMLDKVNFRACASGSFYSPREGNFSVPSYKVALSFPFIGYE